jgi:SAM-dependent methyltransferase
VVGDFTELPFEDNSFALVVFDPPHRFGLKDSWFLKRYGTYDTREEMLDNIVRGFAECMRVLKPDGVLVFKWSEIQIPTPDIIKAIGYQPLFGHHSGKKSNTNWLCFMKDEPTLSQDEPTLNQADRKTEPTISKMEQVEITADDFNEDDESCENCRWFNPMKSLGCNLDEDECYYSPKDEPQTERSE